ncbi:mitotic spindle biogenesis protein [Ophiostoma piceae UAMH 11346]|uniref:DASH complex subunit SPC19 n=1 Tax=Ophiostoma piceae (strain UAMH 11346) TaxID=1262450 RepID=S3C6J3_OPHP1|nr:mitotic spindle biogenesis protein [Ophiostoma piceae UAMH 11346]
MSTLHLYGDCVASLRSSLSFLESSVATLDAGVEDLPRLATVLSSVRHYELLPQPTLAAAEASLQNDIGPAVASLLDRAAHQLARQARRIDTLQAKAALQAGRLEGDRPKPEVKKEASMSKMGKIAKSKVDPLKARMVRQRREQLKYSVARLEREVAQKEREMRQRMRQSTAGF